MLVRGLYKNREFHVPFSSMIHLVLKFTLSLLKLVFLFQQQVNYGPEWNVESLFQKMPFTSISLIYAST